MFKSIPDKALDATDAIVSWISFEVLLKGARRSNGGAIVFLRALLTSLVAFASALLFTQVADPAREMTFSASALIEGVAGKLSWLGALFGAIYLALYTRFSSQWTYVANLYNQIKAAEAKANAHDNLEAIAQWKAGFIEDAQELHLATKGIFAGVVKAWLSDEKVRDYFVRYAPGGADRVHTLEQAVVDSCHMQAAKYEKRANDPSNPSFKRTRDRPA
jgi:hypothetical protein